MSQNFDWNPAKWVQNRTDIIWTKSFFCSGAENHRGFEAQTLWILKALGDFEARASGGFEAQAPVDFGAQTSGDFEAQAHEKQIGRQKFQKKTRLASRSEIEDFCNHQMKAEGKSTQKLVTSEF